MSKAKPTKAPTQQATTPTPVAVAPAEVTQQISTPVEPTAEKTVEASAKKPVSSKATAPSAAKPAKTTPVVPPASEVSAKPTTEPVKAAKAKKPKLVRDSFTFPEADYALIAGLKLRALSQGMEFKKSEILRAGLVALQALSDADLLKVLSTVERIKTGRPAKK